MNQNNSSALIEAVQEFLSRSHSGKIVAEGTGTYHQPYKGSTIAHKINHTYEAGVLKSRIEHHKSDMEEDAPDAKTHMENAKAAYAAHLHASKVNRSNASESEKHEATKKAVHAHVKYWKNDPVTYHDAGSSRLEDKVWKKSQHARKLAGSD